MEDITERAPARNNLLLACTSARSAIRGREWWAAEAARTDTDWAGLVVTAFEMMVAAGIIEPGPNTNAPRSTTMANPLNSRKGISR
jgi:hypothetical protein